MWRPQFRLRSLLISVTVCAVLAWVGVVGWPWWQLYREQAVFEESLKQLRAGTTQRSGGRLVRHETPFTKSMGGGSTPTGEYVLSSVYSWENACYCICYVLSRQPAGDPLRIPTSRIEVYRLPPVPPNYESPNLAGGFPATNYVRDSLPKMFGGRQGKSGEEVVLIYSDP